MAGYFDFDPSRSDEEWKGARRKASVMNDCYADLNLQLEQSMYNVRTKVHGSHRSYVHVYNVNMKCCDAYESNRNHEDWKGEGSS